MSSWGAWSRFHQLCHCHNFPSKRNHNFWLGINITNQLAQPKGSDSNTPKGAHAFVLPRQNKKESSFADAQDSANHLEEVRMLKFQNKLEFPWPFNLSLVHPSFRLSYVHLPFNSWDMASIPGHPPISKGRRLQDPSPPAYGPQAARLPCFGGHQRPQPHPNADGFHGIAGPSTAQEAGSQGRTLQKKLTRAYIWLQGALFSLHVDCVECLVGCCGSCSALLNAVPCDLGARFLVVNRVSTNVKRLSSWFLLRENLYKWTSRINVPPCCLLFGFRSGWLHFKGHNCLNLVTIELTTWAWCFWLDTACTPCSALIGSIREVLGGS